MPKTRTITFRDNLTLTINERGRVLDHPHYAGTLLRELREGSFCLFVLRDDSTVRYPFEVTKIEEVLK